MQRVIRSVSSGLSLNLAALLAHHLAGGHTVSGLPLLSSLLIVIAISLVFSATDLEGPRLGLLILFSQLFTHMILGSNSGDSTSMAVSHIISGVFAYTLIARIDETILWLGSAFASILLVSPVTPSLQRGLTIPTEGANHSIHGRFVAFQYWTTSPPLVATF